MIVRLKSSRAELCPRSCGHPIFTSTNMFPSNPPSEPLFVVAVLDGVRRQGPLVVQ
ncbi:hypothetical protein BC835DRAFT_599372 [Cytidiella melzeri]|nr:hypothetical protein BC835DRAFT_599372 [Cytidiella melzeri]